MKHKNFKFPCLIAALYFGMNVNAQETPKDTLKTQKIEEVVMIGYGTRKKVDNTTAISTIGADEITKMKVLNATQAIQGKAAGVQVTSSDLPGSTPTIIIRGLGTVQSGKNVLYIVDGLFADNLNNINTNDITSYDVLKDASALAIYGNRGANGVVIVTTKSGRGKLSVEYDGFTGARVPLRKVKMAGSNLFANYNNLALGSTKFSQDQPVNTDWFDTITRVGTYNQHNISISGSSESAKYYLSLSNYDEKSILKGTDYNRTTVRTNNEFKIAKKITFTQTLSVAFVNTTPKPLGAFTTAYKQSPIVPVFFANGAYGESFVGANGFADPVGGSRFNNVGNPLAQLELNNERQKSLQLQGGLKLDMNIYKDLKFTSQFSGEMYDFKKYAFDNGFRLAGESPASFQNRLTNEKQDYFNWTLTNYLTYNKKFGSTHDIEATVGTETSVKDGTNQLLYVRDNVPAIQNYWDVGGIDNAGDNLKSLISVNGNENRTLSYFARAQYKLMNRYLLTATFRRDGSSQFSEGNKWGNFPSFGAGWVVSEESFLRDVTVLNELKFRGGWGRLGNQNIGLNILPFASGNSYNYSFGGVNNANGNTINKIIDPNLSWEVTEETSGGVDFEMLNRRLSGSVDLYRRVTKNVILALLPYGPTGISDAGNAPLGQVSNKGVEVSLGWKDKLGDDWSYSLNANYSYNKNNLDNIADSNVSPIQGGGLGNGQFTKLFSTDTVGQPLGSFYLWEVNGYDADGNFTYTDTNGNGSTGSNDQKDRKFFGSYIPKSTVGVNIDLNYKNIDFSVGGYGAFGFNVYNGKKAQRFSGENIEYSIATDYAGPTNLGAGNPAPFNAVPIASNYYLESGDFFRVNNITLGYSLMKPIEQITSLRFYVSSINPFITQKFSGFTPELNGDGNPYGSAGIELDAYPSLRSFLFGMNIKF